jgi:hypothetical protein
MDFDSILESLDSDEEPEIEDAGDSPAFEAWASDFEGGETNLEKENEKENEKE